MVHLEVTGKENRALCITNGDKDKHSAALRNLSKGLFKHVLKPNTCFVFFNRCVAIMASLAFTAQCWCIRIDDDALHF